MTTYRQAKDVVAELGLHKKFKSADEIGRVAIMNGLKLEAQRDACPKTILYEPGVFPHTQHGIINPSCVQDGQDLTIIYRTEPSSATWSGYLLTDKGIPQLGTGKITRKGIELNDPQPIESGVTMACRPEDWRLFRHNEHIYTNFTNYFYLNKGWPQKVVRCVTALGVLVEGRVQFVRECTTDHLGMQMNKEEKNWVFFSHNDLLYCVYSVEPYVIFRCDDTGKPHEIISSEIRLPRLGDRFLANSTNPIPVNLPNLGDGYLMFVHQYLTPNGRGSRNRTYYQHALFISAETLMPVAWTPYPIVGGGVSTKGRHDGVIYISGAFTFDNKIYMMAGEGDSSTVMFELTIKDLCSWLTLL